ncbi:IS1380 family transposase [Candidatus Margulisiibacteriota bacterium]
MNKNNRKSNQEQLFFSFNDKLVADFNGGQVSSDGGLVLLREFDKKTSFIQSLNKCIQDPRNPLFVAHQQEELLRQRIFQIVLGYEDADDSDLLRHDPLFQLTVKNHKEKKIFQLNEIKELASQPTISRLENRIFEEEISWMNNFLLGNYIKSRKKPPKSVVLDLDSTNDPTHGHQQLSMYHGYYGETIYHPLLIYEDESKLCLGAFLRPGNVHTANNALECLRPIVKRLKNAFPKTKITIREDAGFSSPENYQFCEDEGLIYVVGIGPNNILKKLAKKDLTKARKLFKKNKGTVHLYNSFKYKAESWDKKRKIVYKIEINEHKEEIRFVVTNKKGNPRPVYELYGRRGNCENQIKEYKIGFKADRLSCHRFWANYFRLLLHACAYNFIALFKINLKELAGAQIDTLRLKLFKVGAWIQESTRRIWLHLSSSWPFRSLFQQAYKAIRGSPAFSLA